MTILESIHLANFRRFGSDVTIPFGSGATILVAPNGTGKTSVLEAVELALVGSVRRAKESRLPLIREGTTSATVRLNFDYGELTARVVPDSISLSGEVGPILGESSREDADYLLRLTHLLDQRDRNWFIHQDDERVAGDLLARLPSGRDATAVFASLTSTSKSMTSLVNDLERQANFAATTLAQWNNLLERRDAAKVASGGALLSIESIAARLAALSSPAGETLPADPQHLLDRLASVETRTGALAATLSRRVVSMEGLEALPARYVVLRDEANILRDQLADVQEKLERLRLSQGTVLEEGRALAESRSKIEIEVAQISDRVRLADSAAELLNQRSLAEQSVNAAQAELGELELAEPAAAAALADVISRNDAVAKVRERKQLHQQDVDRLAGAQNALEVWEKEASARQQIEAQLAAAHVAFSEATAQEQGAQAAVDLRRQEAKAADAQLVAASSAVDATRAALATIFQHLDEAEGDCPTCGVHHGQEELRRRVEAALTRLSPKVARATQERAAAAASLRTAEDILERASAERRLKSRALSALQESLKAVDARIVSVASHFAAKGIAAARDELSRRQEEIQAAAKEIAVAESKCRPVSHEELASARAESNSIQARLSYAKAKLESAKSMQVAMATRVDLLPESNWMTKSEREEAEIRVRDLRRELADVNRGKAELDSKSASVELDITSTRAEASRIEFSLNAVDAEMKRAANDWISAGFPGTPSATDYAATLASERQQASVLDTQLAELLELKTELARWSVISDLKRISDEIELLKGSLSETEKTLQLTQAAESTMRKHQSARERRKALSDLSSSLSKQIDSVSDRVRLVVPQWQKLLKRVVRDPRYARVDLDVTHRQKKYEAMVSVPLGSGAEPVARIASEAQLADVQLTFLLAMAAVHPWSGWKALLLDDPTQHHDLVHASAVFDVLRDYIVDGGFQLLFSTHDEGHANFLARKLRNDSVPVRLCRLQPTRNGVRSVLS